MNEMNIFFAIPLNIGYFRKQLVYLAGSSQNIVAYAPFFAGKNQNQ